MADLWGKPPVFRSGDQQVSADALNKMREAIPRLITGDGIQVRKLGDRVVLESDPPLVQQDSVVRTFVVLEEQDDILICVRADMLVTKEPYDENLAINLIQSDNLESASSAIAFVAKPHWFQKTVFEEASVLLDGHLIRFTSTGIGRRLAEPFIDTDSDTDSTIDDPTPYRQSTTIQKITPEYFPGAIITAYNYPTGLSADLGDGIEYRIVWTDLNTAGRKWESKSDAETVTIVNGARTVDGYFDAIWKVRNNTTLSWMDQTPVWVVVRDSSVMKLTTGKSYGGTYSGVENDRILFAIDAIDSTSGYTGCIAEVNGCTGILLYNRYQNGRLISSDSINPCDDCGSGSGLPGGGWWCCILTVCSEDTCESCDSDSKSFGCVNYPFSGVGDSRCVDLGGGVWQKQTADKGPFINESSCIAACSGVVVDCRCSPVSSALCAIVILPCGTYKVPISYGTYYLPNLPTSLQGPDWYGLLPINCVLENGTIDRLIVVLICSGGAWTAAVYLFYDTGIPSDYDYYQMDEGTTLQATCEPFKFQGFFTIYPPVSAAPFPTTLNIYSGACSNPSEAVWWCVSKRQCDSVADCSDCAGAITFGCTNATSFFSGGGEFTGIGQTRCVEITPGVTYEEWTSTDGPFPNEGDCDATCGGSTGPITMAGLGNATSGGALVGSLTKTVTVETGTLVVHVNMMYTGAPPDISVSFNGTMPVPTTQTIAVIADGINLFTATFSRYVTVPTTGDIVVTLSDPSAALQLIAINILGLVANVPDVTGGAANSGTASAPTCGPTTASGIADEGVTSCYGLIEPGGTWTWNGTPVFTNGGQDVSDTFSGKTVVLTEGRYISNTLGQTFQSQLNGITPDGFGGMVLAFF